MTRHTRALPARSDRNRIIAGVCGGISERLGIDVTLIRLAFVVFTLAWVGVPVYLLAWLLLPRAAPGGPPAADVPASTVTRRALGLVLAALGTVLLARHLRVTLPDAYIWPALCAALGVGVVVWRVQPIAAVGRAFAVRMASGTILVAFGIGVLVAANLSLWVVLDGLLSTVLVMGGLTLILGPWVAVLVRDRRAERQQRIRADARAEVAAHLHDSVLQTLALVQRSDDPAHMSALARHQERELRGWLYGERYGEKYGPGPQRATLKVAVEHLAGVVEDRHGSVIDVVVVGDATLDAATESLVAATGEAMTNAARWSGQSDIGVFAEATDGQVEVFVRDRGVGFDPETVGDDHHGIRDSIRGRLQRVGGECEIISSPGQGTEVRLCVPRT
ncbi:MAG: PspC domain-containing protein [Acidimicrobiaceae bacterium]|nr:PspC domain-containing protein [Acidimicrobiia bacterium]MCY4495390.1 PspC domain-containing protein [Acidimicrobiaceae bacterium]